MMPNMDPRAMKGMLAKMGIKTDEVDAIRVVIEGRNKNIIVTDPQVTRISAQGAVSFQVAGNVTEEEKNVSIEITEEDVKLVMESAGVDEQRAKAALEASNGDIAAAILSLKEESTQ